MKDGEGIDQSTFMHITWTRTTMGGMDWLGMGTGEEQVGLGEGGEGEKSGNKCNSLNNKNINK